MTTVRERWMAFRHFVRGQDPSPRICVLFDKLWDFYPERDYPNCPLTWEEIMELVHLGFVHIEATQIHPKTLEPHRLIHVREVA